MLKFDRQGLIPAVIQDDVTNEVLMMAFMNEEAYRLTRETGSTHFFSRSRNAIWRKGEQSGHVQEVRAIFVNCEENSLLVRVTQHGDAACHTGYRSCYYRRILPNDSYEITAERIFDPDAVYGAPDKIQSEGMPTQVQDPLGDNGNESAPCHSERSEESQSEDAAGSAGGNVVAPLAGAMLTTRSQSASGDNGGERATARSADIPGSDGNDIDAALEAAMRKLYGAYLYLRDRDLSEQSNTSRLLHESLEPASGTPGYLLSRLADEIQELLSVQSGEHVHAGRQHDTILEGSQVGYWLMLLAASHGLQYDDVLPHLSIAQGYNDTSRPYDGEEITGEEAFISPAQECLNFLRSGERNDLVAGLRAGFALIGWACAQAGVSVLAPVEYDLEQMRRKGLVE